MKLAALALCLAACGSSSSTADAPPVDDAVCKMNLEAELDRSCTSPSDCVLVQSEDCCGPIMLAVHAGTESTFPTSEHEFEVCLACPPLGCAHQTQDELGRTPMAGQTIIADCVVSRCVATIQ